MTRLGDRSRDKGRVEGNRALVRFCVACTSVIRLFTSVSYRGCCGRDRGGVPGQGEELECVQGEGRVSGASACLGFYMGRGPASGEEGTHRRESFTGNTGSDWTSRAPTLEVFPNL